MKIFVLLFADDLVLFAETVIELQRMINRLAEYCDLWHIKVHVLKTKVIIFRHWDRYVSTSIGNLKIQSWKSLHTVNTKGFYHLLETQGFNAVTV